nr:tyrosine-type recombinase/integrase [Gluconobacter morbifer]
MARRAGWIATNPVPDGFRDLVRFLARTGCRQEEGASLEWGQLDLVKSTCTFTKTKTRSPRVITLSPRLIGDLIRQRERRRFDQYVFVGPHGDRYSNVTGRFRVLMSKALPDDSQRFQCHDLRHTYAIRSLQQGRSIYDSRHLEHGSVKATEIYLTWLTKRPG